MRTHEQIIDDLAPEGGTGPGELARLIAPDLGHDHEVVRKRVWAWRSGGSIPGEYWALLARKGIATVEELGAAAEAKKLPEVAAQATAA